MSTEVWNPFAGWDHVTDSDRNGETGEQRGRCSCGWAGPWHRGQLAGWEATADADEHVNEQ